ncbi:hypothetical protein [Escherichia coli]|uniref:hypothetical protein n=1 Tax=Escherichia coli TaxID=562 RepID=UPI003C766410
MFTIDELSAERDSVLIRARQITAYINSDEFYAPTVTEAERYHVKKQERALLEYHANLINQIELKTYPIQSS